MVKPMYARALCMLTAIALGGCGGGGDSPSIRKDPGFVNISASRSMVPLGDSVTLTWNASSGECAAEGGWSGTKAGSGSVTLGPLMGTLSFGLSCPGNDTTNAATGTVRVTVTDPQFTAPTATRVVSDYLTTALDYQRREVKTADLVWDSRRARLLVATLADSPQTPNALLQIDPMTGATHSVSLGAQPSVVAQSTDGQYVYVGFAAGGAIRRFLADGLVPDLAFTVGGSHAFIEKIVPSPFAADTVAVIAHGLTDDSEHHSGLGIFDGAVARPNMLEGWMPLPANPLGTWINVADAQWSADGSQIMAVVWMYSQGLVDLAVDSQGITAIRQRPWPIVSAGRIHGDRYFLNNGLVFNLNGPIEQLGAMPDRDNSWWYRAEVPANGKAFSVERHLLPGAFEDGITINAYDIDTYAYIDSITFNGIAEFDGGKVIAWGEDGLAVGGRDALLIARGSFAAAGGIPPAPPDTPPISAHGVATGNDGQTLNYRVLDVGGRDVADSCGRLFMATMNWAWKNPSSVVEVDVASGSQRRAVHVTGEPNFLAASDDCSTMYAALEASNAVARIRLSDMTVDARLPLGAENGGFNRLSGAQSISVAPGAPRTIAIARNSVGDCGGTLKGVAIFDDLTKRPIEYVKDQFRTQSVAWGANANTLYVGDVTGTYALDVDASGAGNERLLFPYAVGTSIDGLGRDLRFDRGANRIYNTMGEVFDTAANVGLGRLPLLVDRPGIGNFDCVAPTMINTSDATTGKVFNVAWISGSGLGISAFDKATLKLLGRVELSASMGAPQFWFPRRVVRPTSDSLAIVTWAGQLILLQGSLLRP